MEGRGKRRGAAAPEGERKRADRRGYRSVEVGCGSAPAGERVGQNDRASRLVCSAMCQPSAPGVFVPFLVEAAAEAPSEAPSPSGSASPSGAPAPRRIVAFHFAAVGAAPQEPRRIDVRNDALQEAFDQFLEWLPENALLVSTAQAVRQTLFPIAVNRNGVAPPACFRAFVNIEKCAAGFASDAADVRQMVKLVEIAQQQDVSLVDHVEEVKTQLEQAVCFDTNAVEPDVVVRARGLPWQASDQDVANFFAGLNIAPGGVALCLSAEGRRNGEALVRFEDATQRSLALQRNRHFLHNRYIEVYRASSQDFLRVAVGSSLEAMNFVNRAAGMIVRMRGLPYDCSEAEIREFFRSGEAPVEVLEQGVFFVNKADGRPSGDAFVLFADEAAGARALQKDRAKIGARYIELFRSTQAEVQQVVSKSQQSPQPSVGPGAPRRDCIRLRGLPYEAQVSNIVEFLGPSARHIVYQGVHMVFNKQGHPSGEAFIQMDSEASAAAAAFSFHNKYMEMGKKKRYIEVFQCSPDDMNLIIAPPSPMLVPNQPMYPGAGVLTPSNAMMSGYPQAYWPQMTHPVAPYLLPPGMVYLPPEVLSQMSHMAPMTMLPEAHLPLGQADLRYRNPAMENPQAPQMHLSLIHT